MKEYKVTDKHPAGLTVNDYVYKPGRKFFANEWKWGDDALAAAIESGRCKMIYDDSEENIKKNGKLESGLEKKKAELEKLQAEYSELDSSIPKAQKILEKIKKLEEELSL